MTAIHDVSSTPRPPLRINIGVGLLGGAAVSLGMWALIIWGGIALFT